MPGLTPIKRWRPVPVLMVVTVVSVVLYLAWFGLWPDKPDVKLILAAPAAHAGRFLLTVLAMLFLHELLHLCSVLRSLTASETQFGFNPRSLMFYTVVAEPLSKSAAIRYLILPFLILSVVPLGARLIYPALSGWLGVLAVTNAGCSGFDLCFALQIMKHVPAGARRVCFSLTGICVQAA